MKKTVLKITAAVSAAFVCTCTPVSSNDAAYALEYETVEIIEKDTTGDGTNEKIKILGDEKHGGYHIDVIHRNGKTYRLKADEKLQSLGHYTAFYGLKTIIVDINGDQVPEITTVGSGTHEVPLHVFRWDGLNYKLVFSTWTYSSFKFKDITGDDVPELVIYNRLYGTGDEEIYYQWKEGRYRRIYYEMYAARGFDRLRDVLEMIGNDAFPFSEDIPQREKLLKNYFTEEWVSKKDNIKYLEQWTGDLLSIQISEFLGIDEKRDPDNTDKIIREKWKFKVKVFRISDSKIFSENLIMEVDIKPIEGFDEVKWRIDNLRFRTE